MTARPDHSTVTCLSDMGTADESVGVIHSILRQSAPGAAVIDLCHQIDPDDVRTAALMLARSVPYLAPGVVLASVGRRLDRPAIAVSVGKGQSMLVGPDNGVLAATTAAVGGADIAVRIECPGGRDPASVLHPMRDVLAPAAGRLAADEPVETLGTPIDPALLMPSLVAVPRVDDDGSVTAEVLSVTRWGTVQLNVDRDTLAPLGNLLVAEWTDNGPTSPAGQANARLASAGSPGTSGLELCDDPFGLLELTVAGRSAAHLGFAPGAEVRLRPAT
ncbi:SAM hydrolase/SAM-dependent halogenase family protein [Candidatus Poriferisodalis sp.]|uniref:SAM hydrolase/SAM-dependent halogenase family protein n=1 Tax=Candidatus Poriferisodalis sp. TaxID=3101277 RepID=UPI003B0248BC